MNDDAVYCRSDDLADDDISLTTTIVRQRQVSLCIVFGLY